MKLWDLGTVLTLSVIIFFKNHAHCLLILNSVSRLQTVSSKYHLARGISSLSRNALTRVDSKQKEEESYDGTSPHEKSCRSISQKLPKAILSIFFSFATLFSGPVMLKEVSRRSGFGSSIADAVLKNTLASASMLKKFTDRTLYEKMANVPVFVVTNAAGQPYLVPTYGDSSTEGEAFSAGLFFFDPEDAEAMMTEMLQSAGGRPDARIFAINLEKAAAMAFQPAKELGVGQMIGFRFFPNSKQLENCGLYASEAEMKIAERAAKDQKGVQKVDVYGTQSLTQVSIPLFYVPGLQIKKDRANVKPLFFSLEDAKGVWEKAKKRDKENLMPDKMKAHVLDFFGVLTDMQQNPSETQEYGFFPMKKAIDFVKKVKRTGSSQARLHRRLR